MEYIDIHTHNPIFTVKSIVNLFPDVNPVELPSGLFSVGLHPWFVGKEDEENKMKKVREMAQHPSCVAIGETGLDKVANAGFDVQTAILNRHIAIAEELGKPLILHCVKSFNEIIKLKKETRSHVPWIVHGFNAKLTIARQLISEGFFLSFGKALVYPGSNAQKALEIVPEQSFFLETDDCDLSIQEIYETAASVRNVSLNSIATAIEINFIKNFKR